MGDIGPQGKGSCWGIQVPYKFTLAEDLFDRLVQTLNLILFEIVASKIVVNKVAYSFVFLPYIVLCILLTSATI